MSALFTSDNLATLALAAVALLAAWGVCHTEPGGLTRALGGEHTGRHVRPAGTARDPHAKPLVRHAAPHGVAALPAAPAPSAVETVPDPVSPFAPRKFA